MFAQLVTGLFPEATIKGLEDFGFGVVKGKDEKAQEG